LTKYTMGKESKWMFEAPFWLMEVDDSIMENIF
jgi:hypothetical protein